MRRYSDRFRRLSKSAFSCLISQFFTTTYFFSRIAENWLKEVDLDTKVLATITLPKNQIRDEQQRDLVLECATQLPVDGIYLIVTDVDENVNDVQLISAILEFIFWLKYHEFEVILGFSGGWGMLGFPFGLDGFASSGRKNRRSFQSEVWGRGAYKPSGFGRRTEPPLQYWSQHLFHNIRIPDDAELFERSGIWKRFDAGSPYGCSFDVTPSVARAMWSESGSHKHYLWEMNQLASEFTPLSLTERVDLVRKKIDIAKANHDELRGQMPWDHGQCLTAWREALDLSIDAIGNDLVATFDS